MIKPSKQLKTAQYAILLLELDPMTTGNQNRTNSTENNDHEEIIREK